MWSFVYTINKHTDKENNKGNIFNNGLNNVA